MSAVKRKKKMVIDCDPGNDDASAILMALNDPEVDVIAITCVEGNTNVRQTALNALRTLKMANRLDKSSRVIYLSCKNSIPVYAGCNTPLLGEVKPRSPYHGNDGFGDTPDPMAPDDSNIQPEHAVDALIRLSKQYNGELLLVAIGPLTNLAVALRLDPGFGNRLQSCWIMGGNYLGKGNITACGEFNFYFDPEAAYVVLNQLGCPIMIVPWETCLQHALTWDTYHKLRNVGTPKAEFMKTIDAHSIEHVTKKGNRVFIPADEALMACTLNRDVIKTSVHVYATVETKGHYTWGQMVVDWQGKLGKDPNVTIVTDMDQSLYERILQRAFE